MSFSFPQKPQQKPASADVFELGFNGDGVDDQGDISFALRPMSALIFVAVLAFLYVSAGIWAVAAVGVFAFVLFMHELGHYLTARASGMYVSQFFVGFGPKIFSVRYRGCEYGLKAIWAGAYVRILGMTNLEDVPDGFEHRTYRHQSYLKRMWVITAGSAMHFGMAFIALLVLFGVVGSYGTQAPDQSRWHVGRVVPGSAAEQIGLAEGDKIISIDGVEVVEFTDLSGMVKERAGESLSFLVERDSQQLQLTGTIGVNPIDVISHSLELSFVEFPAPSSPNAQNGDQPLNQANNASPGTNSQANTAPSSAANTASSAEADQSASQFVVERVADGSKAQQSNISSGDSLATVDGVVPADLVELAAMLFAKQPASKNLEFVTPTGEARFVTVSLDAESRSRIRGFLGVARALDAPTPLAAGPTLKRSVQEFWAITKQSLGIFDVRVWMRALPSFGDSPEEQATAQPQAPASVAVASEGSGGGGEARPVSIIGVGRIWTSATNNESRLFIFVMVNIAVGVINLAPLLPFDGGHAAIATIEKIRETITGKHYRVNAAKLLPLTALVVFALIIVGVWTVANDIFAWGSI